MSSMIKNSNSKRYGLVIPPTNACVPAPLSSSSTHSSVNYSSLDPSSSANNRRSISLSNRLPSASATLSLDTYLANNVNINNIPLSPIDNSVNINQTTPSANRINKIDIYKDHNSPSSIISNSLDTPTKREAHREHSLNKLAKQKKRSSTISFVSSPTSTNKENSHHLSINTSNLDSAAAYKLQQIASNSNASSPRDSMSPTQLKRRTPLLSRGSSNLKETPPSNTNVNNSNALSLSSSRRMSTYSIASTASTRSASSSLKRMSHMLVGALIGGNGSNPNSNSGSGSPSTATSPTVDTEQDDVTSIASSAKKRLSTIEGKNDSSSNSQKMEVITKLKTPDSITEKTHKTIKMIPGPIPEPTRVTTTITLNNPELKKKSSRLRLRHSISLRSLLGRDSSNTSDLSERQQPESEQTHQRASSSPIKKMSLTSLRQSFLAGSTSSRQLSSAASNRLSMDTLHFDRAEISAPIPLQATKDKLKLKLRNSSSILSISSVASNTNRSDKPTHAYAIKATELELIHKRLLLKLCNQQRIVSFKSFFNKLISRDHQLVNVGSNDSNFSEVFVEKDGLSGQSLCAYKVIPFGDEEFDQLLLKEVIQELSISMCMSSVDGFVQLKAARVVKGEYPIELLSLCGRNTHDRITRLRSFKPSQMYLIMKMEYGGVDLKHFQINNWVQCFNIFKTIVNALSQAEESREFEHRDLHWGNILIKSVDKRKSLLRQSELGLLSPISPTTAFFDAHQESNDVEIRLIDFTLSRAKVGDNVMFTGLDNPSFFKGKGDYQFTIYRLMRQALTSSAYLSNSPKIPSNASFTISSTAQSVNSMNRPISPPLNNNDNVDTDDMMSIQTMPEFHPPTSIRWSVHEPRTNLLWLHYILDKLINEKGLAPIRMSPILKGGSHGSKQLMDESSKYELLSDSYKLLNPLNGVQATGKKKLMQFSSVADFEKWLIGKEFGY